MSDGANNFIPTSRNWQAGRDYGNYAPNTGIMSGGTNSFMPTSRNWLGGHDYGYYAPHNNTMNGGANNIMPSSRNLQARHDYGDHAPNTSDWSNRQGLFPRSVSVSFHADPVASRGASYPRQSFQDRVITEPFGLPGFPVVSHSPMQIPVADNVIGRYVNPSHRQIIRGSSRGSLSAQDNMQALHSGPTPDEQQTALKKLKKETYNPPSKKLPMCLYYREDAIKIYREREKAKEDDAKSCAVCLEDFEPKETVMVTPCKHMFHEACIVPWVKSNGHCPVCRFAICRPKSGGASADNTAIAAGNDISVQELITILRHLEDPFSWNDNR